PTLGMVPQGSVAWSCKGSVSKGVSGPFQRKEKSQAMTWESWFSCVEKAIVSALSPGDKPAERVYWVGRDTDGRRYILTDTGGDRWVLKVTGGNNEDPYTGRQLEETAEFIEIKLDTGQDEDRVRICKDKLLFAAKDGPRGWLEMAKGR